MRAKTYGKPSNIARLDRCHVCRRWVTNVWTHVGCDPRPVLVFETPQILVLLKQAPVERSRA